MTYKVDKEIFKGKIKGNTDWGSGVLSGKMLLGRIIENNKIDAYFRAG